MRARRRTARRCTLERRGGRAEPRQGARQRPAEDDLQDGHLDDPVLLRRADLRGRRPRARADRQALHRHRLAHRRRRRSRCSRPRRSSATRAPTRVAATTSCCPSAASTRGGATASTTCGTPRRSRSSSTPCARPTATWARRSQGDERGACEAVRESPAFEKYREYARAVNEDAARKATLRGLLEIGTADARPTPRADPARARSSRRARSSSASARAR